MLSRYQRKKNSLFKWYDEKNIYLKINDGIWPTSRNSNAVRFCNILYYILPNQFFLCEPIHSCNSAAGSTNPSTTSSEQSAASASPNTNARRSCARPTAACDKASSWKPTKAWPPPTIPPLPPTGLLATIAAPDTTTKLCVNFKSIKRMFRNCCQRYRGLLVLFTINVQLSRYIRNHSTQIRVGAHPNTLSDLCRKWPPLIFKWHLSLLCPYTTRI